jgi:4-amino-4-deoxychorismate lyase
MVSAWINCRRDTKVDYRDRGLQYGDGIFETMRVRRRRVRLLDFHLERLYEGCERLNIIGPEPLRLRRELERTAALRNEAVLKLIVTRGAGTRGYRPSGSEQCTRIVSLHPYPGGAAMRATSARVRVCATPLNTNPALAGLKTLNRLDSVLARTEWRDAQIWEGLMRDVEGNWICGTMSNLFLKRDDALMTPRLDRCGTAGVMRRWVMSMSRELRLRMIERRIRWEDLESADEVFMTNAVVGIRTVRSIEWPQVATLGFRGAAVAKRLRELLEEQ